MNHRVDDGNRRVGNTMIASFFACLLFLFLENVADCFGRQICGDLMAFWVNINSKLFAAGSRFMEIGNVHNGDGRKHNNQSKAELQ